MSLDNDTRRELKRIAHHLDPVVTVADRGLTDAVVAEVERALFDHELIKVKFAIADRDVRALLRSELCARTGAEDIAAIGRIGVIFKANPKAKPRLSNLQRARGGHV